MKIECLDYQPIGTGECWNCGKPFYHHWTIKNIDQTLPELIEVNTNA